MTEIDEAWPRIEIAGDASEDERDAIVAALAVLALRRAVTVTPVASGPTAWARTARREGIRVDRPEWGRYGNG